VLGTDAAQRPLREELSARVSTRDKEQDLDLRLVPLRGSAAARGRPATEDVAHATERVSGFDGSTSRRDTSPSDQRPRDCPPSLDA